MKRSHAQAVGCLDELGRPIRQEADDLSVPVAASHVERQGADAAIMRLVRAEVVDQVRHDAQRARSGRGVQGCVPGPVGLLDVGPRRTERAYRPKVSKSAGRGEGRLVGGGGRRRAGNRRRRRQPRRTQLTLN